jgi:hypothetical protein
MANAEAYCYSALVDLSAAKLGYTWKFTLHRATESNVDVEVEDMTAHASKYIYHATSGVDASSVSPAVGTPWDTYDSAASATEAAMEAETSGWSNSNFSVTFNHATGIYTFDKGTGGGAFDITFANTDTANFFGFTSVGQSGTSIYTGSCVADYCIVPSISARSQVSREYEPGNISSLAVADSGKIGTGIVRASVPLYYDWQQPFEEQEAVHTADATSSILFTWQQFWEHCRQEYPFIVHTATSTFDMFMLRETASNWNPEPTSTDDHTRWHIPFECHFMGRI